MLAGEAPVSLAASSALLKTVFMELPWIRCREIDLDPKSGDFEGLASELASASMRAEVAIRAKSHYTPVLRSVDVLRAESARVDKIHLGLWVITGGLGGVGTELALHLMQETGVRLLLLGRTPLAQIESEIEASHDVAHARNYSRLREAGTQFVYRNVELSDPLLFCKRSAECTLGIAFALSHGPIALWQVLVSVGGISLFNSPLLPAITAMTATLASKEK